MIITEFKSCVDRKGRELELSWDEIVDKFSEPFITHETLEEYKKMSKDEQASVKDVGGFVGGKLKDGSRKNGCVINRCILTLDIDYPAKGILDLIGEYKYLIYSTHSSWKGHERYRLLIPLDRPVNDLEYEAIARRVADDIGIEMFDDTTYQPNRLMYYPSISKDNNYHTYEEDNCDFLCADDILDTYTDYHDILSWPRSSRAAGNLEKRLKKVEDPTVKDNEVGTFCRAYNIHEAIENFLPDVYEPTLLKDRYSYTLGSSYGGAITYEDKFLYSHHATDPTSEQLVNSFDLVRIHKFGELDKDSVKTGVKAPSYSKMLEFCQNDSGFKAQFSKDIELRTESVSKAFESFEDTDIDENAYTLEYEFTENGKIKSTVGNVLIFLKSSKKIKNHVWFDTFSNKVMTDGDLPWRREKVESEWDDSDDAGLRYMVEEAIGISSKAKIDDALSNYLTLNAIDPVKNYLESLEWDGVKRVDNLLINYLGAEDIGYNKYTIRKVLAASVARIYEPGKKFDTMMVLSGAQGMGKSTFIRTLGGKWFSDSLVTVQGKEAFEQLQGIWFAEMGELAATKKADIENIKHFLSKQEDRFRQAYGRRTKNYKRRCVIIGTTNDEQFLRDWTGNRRFWPIECGVEDAKKNVWQDLEKERDQIFAEAVQIYKSGELLYLNKEQDKEAVKMQKAHTESNSKEGLIVEYLDTLIPSSWESWSMNDRKLWYQSPDAWDTSKFELVRRDKVSAIEVWCECFGYNKGNIKNTDSREINAILSSLPDWRKYRSSTRFGIYGHQRGYYRK